MITHGTPTGHDDGCRGANCLHHGSKTNMTCTEARTRYRGDWEYMRAVDAGTATTEKATYSKPGKGPRVIAETAAEANARPARAKRKPSRLRAETVTASKPRGPRQHGTTSMYQAGCHKRDECPMPEGKTCSDVMLAYGRANPKQGSRRRTKPLHGTPSGYTTLKCRKDCPAKVSCTTAARDARRVWMAGRKAAA